MKKCQRLRTLLVTVPFNLTVKVLLFIGKVFHLSYNAVNIIIWYMIFPMFWMAILDYKLTPDSFCSHMTITVLRTRLCAEKEIQSLLRFVIQVVSGIHPFFWQLLPVVCHYLSARTIANNNCFADCLIPVVANPNFGNDEAYASGEIQDNRAANHAANHESLAPIYIHDISLVLDKGDVTE